ncbi:MAG TPA: DUF3618 domain-containing protein [Solirubrobacterales bacterium]|nr:DUF3618 domain-containing protein [Solirubrobacterales bacterium]
MAETAASGPGTPQEKDVEQLQNRIEEQRAEFAETAGALADKADVKKQAKLRLEQAKAGARERIERARETAQANPAPVAAALGGALLLAWIPRRARRGRRNAMAKTDGLALAAPYVERLAGNEYLQENLRDAAANLRAAYVRASKRKVDAVDDRVFKRRLRKAGESLSEARAALLTGRAKPKRSKRRVVVVALAGVGIAGAVAIARDDELRRDLFGDGAG